MERTSFTLASREFFEPLGRHEASPRYRAVVESLLPGGWRVDRSGPWLRAAVGRPVPTQGFKIHVSSIPPHAEAVLHAVVPECVRRRMTFKLAADETLLTLINSKRYGRGASGKFMTLYPADDAEFRETLDALYQATRDAGVAGPYILSDRRYRDSTVLSYRYGGFLERYRLNVDGTKTPLMVGADGREVEDHRDPYFKLPPGVPDPFADTATTRDDDGSDAPLLHARYRIDGVLAFSNSGGVYRATDIRTNEAVVVKEARALTDYLSLRRGAVDSPQLLRREWEILSRLDGSGVAPRPLDFFREWEHDFLVESLVPGTTFWAFWADRSRLLFPHVRRPGRVAEFVPRFRAIGLALLAALERVHERGVLLGDISTRNVLVDLAEPAVRVHFIDVESAAMIDDRDDQPFVEFSKICFTSGFGRPGRQRSARLTPADDYYAVGSLLYSAIVPVQEFFSQSPDAADRILQDVVRAGVPDTAVSVVRALYAGDVDAARRLLGRLPTEVLS